MKGAIEGLKALGAKPAMGAMASPMGAEMEPDDDEAGSPLAGPSADLIAAVKAGDADGVADALHAAYQACMSMDHGE